MTDLLDQFKASLQEKYNPYLHSDYYLNRFLVARNNNLDKAIAMFESVLQWRKDEKVDEIAEEFVFPEMEEVNFLALKQVSKIWPRFYHKTDRQGRPVLVNRHYNLDANKLYDCTTDERILKAHIRELEKVFSQVDLDVELSITCLFCGKRGIYRTDLVNTRR